MATRTSWQHRRVESLEFDPSIGGGEAPVNGGPLDIAIMHPGGDLIDEGGFVRNAAVQALAGQDAEFRFGHVEPASMLGRVVDFQLVTQSPGFVRLERLEQRARWVFRLSITSTILSAFG